MAKAQAATAATQTTSTPRTTTETSDKGSNSKDLSSAGAYSPAAAPASSGITQGQESDASPSISEERIRARAYLFWEQRGCPVGEAELDWLRAEQELSGSSNSSAERG